MLKRTIYKIGLTTLYYLNNEYLYRFLRLFLPPLSNLFLHITNNCNYNCVYCYTERRRPCLEFGVWLKIIEEAKRIGIKKVSFLGGEPFMSPYLDDLLKRTKQLNLKSFIYTNGSLITEEWIEKLKAYGTIVIFKYDLNNEVYQLNTGQYRYNLQDIRKKIILCHKEGIKVMTLTALVRRNIKRIEQMLDDSLRLGAFPVFERYLPVKDNKVNEYLEVSDKEYLLAMRKVNQRLKYFDKEWKAIIRILGGSCSGFREIISITPTGEILPCPYLPESASWGNVRDKSLKEIKNIFLLKKTAQYKIPDECTGCKYKYICRGGCRTYSFLKHGKYLPHCEYDADIARCVYMLIDLYEDLKDFT